MLNIEAGIAYYRELLTKLLNSQPLRFDANLHGALPTKGGVYRISEHQAGWRYSLYIGQAKNLRERIYRNHLMGDFIGLYRILTNRT